MSSKPTLAYWEIRGFAQPIRYLLELTGVEYNDHQYFHVPGGSDDIVGHKNWLKKKNTLGLDFPNLPYWIDNDFKLTHTIAILKYLARKHGLIAQDVKTLAKQEMIEQQLQDYKLEFCDIAYSDKFHEQKDNYSKTAFVQHLDQLNDYLCDNQWFSPEFSYIDVMAYELLDWFRQFSPNTFAKYPRLTKYLNRFENLPVIKKYQNSEYFKSLPLLSPHASWGNKK